jgi:flagellar biosynthesis component FlhA
VSVLVLVIVRLAVADAPAVLFNTCLLVTSLFNLSLATPTGRVIGLVGDAGFLSTVALPFVNFGFCVPDVGRGAVVDATLQIKDEL